MSHLKFLHLSDTHFRIDYGNSLDRWEVDYDPVAVFEEFLSNYHFAGINFVAHTGDLIHDGSAEDYAALKELMDRHVPEDIPVFCCLGNHDKKREFYKGFFGVDQDGLYIHQETINGYRLIFLDTSSEESHDGIISPEQAEGLYHILDEESEAGTLIFQHHPLDISWIRGLERTQHPEGYIERLNQSDTLAIFTGHLHQNRHVMIDRIPQHTAGAFVFGMNRIGGKIWNTNRLGYSEVELHDQQVDVYTEIVLPQVTPFNTEIL